MNMGLLATLLGLRYRLLWALARSRNGKLALFFVGYLFAILIIVLLAAGGVGAALASIRVGRAELVARVVLGGFYLTAMLAAVVLGFGVNPAFSDAALRRYPLTAAGRLATRQLTAFLEPLWMFTLALNLGLAVGFSAFGVASLWLAVPAAVILVLTNYLSARVLLSLVERVMATRAGPLYLILLFLLVSVAGPLLGLTVGHDSAFLTPGLDVLKLTPPFAGAAVMAGAPALSSVYWLLLLLLWSLGLAALLTALDRLPISSQATAVSLVVWDGPCDRFAALFGPTLGPLIARVLRYYVRSSHLRYNYPLAIPVASTLVVTQSRGRTDPMDSFLVALGAICIVGFMSLGGMYLNVFGFDGPGFRRYFFLPVAPAAVLRAAALVPLLLGAALIPVSLGLWLVFSPVHTDARMAAMLLSSGLSGLFLFQALGLWTSLLAPRPTEFNATFGNKGSPAAIVVMICGIVVFLALPQVLRSLGADTVLRYWWVAPLFAAASAAFYFLTLQAGAPVFTARRERLLSLVEGRG